VDLFKSVAFDLVERALFEPENSEVAETVEDLCLELSYRIVTQQERVQSEEIRESVRFELFDIISAQVYRFEVPQTVEQVPWKSVEGAVAEIK